MQQVDCVIVGGGPAGLTAALYLARFRRRVLVFDAGESRARLIGRSHNCPGSVHGISGLEYLSNLREQSDAYDIEHRAEAVVGIERSVDASGGFLLRTMSGTVATSKILLATGIRDRHPLIAEHDEVVREALLRYCPICDGYEAYGLSICVVGPFDLAISKARFLRTFSSSVLLAATDRDPLPDEVARLAQLGVEARRAAPLEMLKDGSGLLVPFTDGSRRRFDIVYPAMGARTASTLIGDAGVTTDRNGLILVDEKNRTNVAGVYAAGDAVSDLHQIAVAIGHAAIASTAMHNELSSNAA